MSHWILLCGKNHGIVCWLTWRCIKSSWLLSFKMTLYETNERTKTTAELTYPGSQTWKRMWQWWWCISTLSALINNSHKTFYQPQNAVQFAVITIAHTSATVKFPHTISWCDANCIVYDICPVTRMNMQHMNMQKWICKTWWRCITVNSCQLAWLGSPYRLLVIGVVPTSVYDCIISSNLHHTVGYCSHYMHFSSAVRFLIPRW